MKENTTKQFSNVFLYGSIIIGILVLIGAIFPDQFGEISNIIGSWIMDTFGWYYMLLFSLILLFSIFLIFSPIGKLTLGKPNDKPEFKTISWLTMLFSAGMGIGLVFYGSSEPVSHFLAPPTADGETKEALAESMRATFLHYGFHPWAVYGMVALALAYSQFRKNELGLISRTLRPIFGHHVEGPLGTIVDVLAVFATVIGVAVSLGVGAMQINGGLNYLFNIPNNQFTQGIIILIITVLFLLSAWSGLSKGIQYLSNLNIGLAAVLLIALLIIGPTLLIMNTLSTSFGEYLNTLIFNSLDVAPLNPQKRDWMESWTIYYWGWWMSWSPFVGIFIARISKGRTIREFISAVILVPTLLSMLWFATFGITGISVGEQYRHIMEMPPETQLFGIFSTLPMGSILSLIALLLIISFFITSADSATFVIGMQTSFGRLTPSGFVKIIWGIALSAIAYILLLAGGETGLDALQSAAIISALPFSIVVIFMVIAFYKDANAERKFLGYTLEANQNKKED
ncbi:BCCT family transporter [Staphylococcus sp. 11261D007BR]